MALNLERRNGILNNDPNWEFITDHNLDEYQPEEGIVDEWVKHSKYLELWLPSDDELRRRWWRLMFISFVQRSLKKKGYLKHPYNQWGTEDYILNEVYPWMKDLWIEQKVRLTAFIPTVPTLRMRWWYGKRHDMVMRYQGGRRSYIRPRVRFDRVLASLVWCRHSQCWKFRLNFVLISILLYFLYCFV